MFLGTIAARCPMIFRNILGHREILEGSSELFVPRDTPTALVAAIDSLLLDRESATQRVTCASLRTENSTIIRLARARASVCEQIFEGEIL